MQKFLNKIIEGDCVQLFSEAKEPFADLIFADPPFNIGYKYDKYKDNRKKEHYIDWTRQWMSACLNVLKPTGSFYIAIGDDYAANVKIIADELGLFCRNWIIWHYTFGQQTKDKFARSHTHIFYLVKDKNNFTFNDFAVRTPSDRQLIYKDSRANSVGKMPDDVWNAFSRVCGTFAERQGWHPCQMPELLLARIIAASSNSGDCVLDPFSGSGTTLAVAAKYGRNYCGIDISEDYVKNSEKRIAEAKSQISNSKSQGFSAIEFEEMKRLFVETGLSIAKLTENDKLLGIFVSQFSLRMNNQKKYAPSAVANEIKKLKSWDNKKK